MVRHSPQPRTTDSLWRASLLACLLAAGFAAPSQIHAAPAAYRFGVFPYLPPSRLDEAYAPIAAEFSRVLGRPVRLVTSNDFERFRSRLTREEIDIALIQPMDVVTLVDRGVYLPLANRPAHSAHLVVLANSAIHSLADLRGETIGLPPDNVPVSVILELNLAEKGLGKVAGNRIRHFGNVLACLHQLLVGRVAACGSGGGASLAIFEKKMGVDLRVLLATPPFPHMLFVVHPRVSARERERLIRTILDWEKNATGRALLKKLAPEARFVPYRSSDYDVIREYWRRWKANPHVLH